MIHDMLRKHLKSEKASFHMPGHKNGQGFLGTPFTPRLFAFDTTELSDTDALIAPKGAILEAEQRTAAYYGAKHSFYLVGGSTCGNLAMIYAAFSQGDAVLLDRNCHASILNAATLSGIKPIYLAPEMSRLPDLPGTVTPEGVAEALRQYPEIRGAVITSPNYYGSTADIQKIAEILHHHNALLLVDEAHGAHFPFAKEFPLSAMKQGADMSVTSLHKTLSAPNQTALLHISKNMDTETVRAAVRMFQTSSPSYIFLSAMETALEMAKKSGQNDTERVLSLTKILSCPTLDDPLKLLPTWAEKGLSGYEAEEILRTKFGIYAEMATSHRVLLMSSWANSKKDFSLLKKALDYLDALPVLGPAIPVPQTLKVSIEQPACDLSELRKQQKCLLPLDAAEGKICAEAVSAFPPCIPILLSGEILSSEKLKTLETFIDQKAVITGLTDGKITVIA